MRALRRSAPVLMAAAIVLVFSSSAFAALADEANWLSQGNNWRGNGFYIGWGKIAATWVVFMLWVAIADWVNRDLEEMGLNVRKWNPIIVGSFMGTMVLTWLIPWFWVNIFLLLVAAVAPTVVYVIERNAQVGYHEKVLTRSHIRHVMASVAGKIGIKMSAEEADPNTSGVPVRVYARGGADNAVDGANLLSARQSPGLPEARKILFKGLAARASAIVLDFGQANVALRYMVDGVWLPQEHFGARSGRSRS